MAQMAAGENERVSGPQRSSQIISVPYLWEAKPGIPKKGWVSKPISMISFPSPARLVASVPFQWEEMPGKPFTQLPQQSSPGSDITVNQSGSLHLLPLSFSSPSTYPNPSHSTQTTGKNPFIDDDDEEEMRPGLDRQAFTLEIAPGLNPFLVSNAHASQESLCEDSSNQQESWFSALERNHHTSPNSFVTTSIDSATLEFRFPLFSPDAGFLKKVCGQDRTGTAAFPQLLSKNSCGSSGRFTVRRPMTLEELILLSRQLSYRMRPIEDRKPSSLMEFMKKRLARFSFINSGQKANRVIRNTEGSDFGQQKALGKISSTFSCKPRCSVL